jgi:hypothetical protein
MIMLKDLARPRKTVLPTKGRYDHDLQQMKGANWGPLASTTQSDEDSESSTTFWDGERQ